MAGFCELHGATPSQGGEQNSNTAGNQKDQSERGTGAVGQPGSWERKEKVLSYSSGEEHTKAGPTQRPPPGRLTLPSHHLHQPPLKQCVWTPP